jgi:hypothetical protein
MSGRLAGLVVALWLIAAILAVSIAARAAHFSVWEFFLPGADPLTWIVPGLLFLPPLLLLALRRARPRVAAASGWVLAALLVGVVAATLLVFSPSAYLGG